MSKPPALRCQGLVKRYGVRRALGPLDLEVGWGEAVAVVGPNGAGKTTLLRLLAGIARPSEGRVWVAGMDLWQVGGPARRLVGLAGHATLLYDDLTAWENLRFYARLYGVPSGRVRSVAERLGFADRLDQRVRTLSHGYQKRVALARALLHDPPILLLDEAEAGLDPSARQTLWALVREHRERGGALLLATHSLEEALAHADRVLVLAEGRALYLGPPEGVTADLRRCAFGGEA